jgi:hypothetical protein
MPQPSEPRHTPLPETQHKPQRTSQTDPRRSVSPITTRTPPHTLSAGRRHSAATHLGDQGVPLQLIMAKTRHRNPRTVMRYVKPGAEAVAEITQLLEPPKRRG